MERLQMCKGRSDDDFEDGDDERAFVTFAGAFSPFMMIR